MTPENQSLTQDFQQFHPPIEAGELNSEQRALLARVEEFLIEKKADDPEEKPGFIHSLPKEYIQLGTHNYSAYLCRGNVMQDLFYRLYPLMEGPNAIVRDDAKLYLEDLISQLVNIYRQEDSEGKKLMRTKAEIEKVRFIISEIVDTLKNPKQKRAQAAAA